MFVVVLVFGGILFKLCLFDWLLVFSLLFWVICCLVLEVCGGCFAACLCGVCMRDGFAVYCV